MDLQLFVKRHQMTHLKLQEALLCCFVILSCLAGLSSGHGRLLDPPSRSSMWRYGFSNPPNYDDNQLYCGGVQVQYEMNGGRCGVCGDPYTGPRENEPGGKYANGIIVRIYNPGQVINVVVELTANHKGYFQFKLCPNDDPRKAVEQECFDQYVLSVVEDRKESKKFYVPNQNGYQKLNLKVRLPSAVRCRNCVFQWKYNAGNSWGTDAKTGRGCMGCGNQEQFYGCADIAIGHREIEEGLSLITGKISKGPPVNIPPPPVEGVTDNDVGWSDEKEMTSVTEARFVGEDIIVYNDFQDFRRRFKNSNIQPCVCHSCIGSTCVCECFFSSGYSTRTSFLQQIFVMLTAVLSFLILWF